MFKAGEGGEMKIISLKPVSFDDRNHLVLALANAGYKVWIQSVPHEDGMYLHERILVRFEYEEKGEGDEVP